MDRVVRGKADVVRLALVVLLAEGHLLVEDVPGVGKTTLAKALAGSIDASVRRIQFTPDLLPSDVTGVAVYDQESREFEFKPGAVFANVVVADEINRASPKTQSALLECMEERQVTVDGVSYELARPFMVVATQNPIEMEGTYPLPEAQRDRFTARVSMGYPDRDAELAMLDDQTGVDPLTTLRPVADAAAIRDLVAAVGRLHVSEAVRRYVVALVEGTRRSTGAAAGRLAAGRAAAAAHRPRRRGARRPGPRAARRRPGDGRAGARPPAAALPRRRRRAAHRRAGGRRPAAHHPRAARALSVARGPVGGALSSLTVRGRCMVAVGLTLLALGALLGELPLRPGGRLRAGPAAAVGAERRPPAVPAVHPPHRHPGAGAPRRRRRRPARGHQRRPAGRRAVAADRAAAGASSAPAPTYVLERLPAGATAPLHYRVVRLPAGPLPARPAAAAAGRPVRAGDALGVGDRRRVAARGAPGAAAAGRRADRRGGAQRRGRPALHRRPRGGRRQHPAPTGTATTCGRCTGGRPRAPAS